LKSVICQFCEQSIPMDAKFCPKCGNPLKNKVCPKCNKINNSDATFCTNCGTKLDSYNYKEKHRKEFRKIIKLSKKPAIFLSIFIIISSSLLLIFLKLNNTIWKTPEINNTTKLNIDKELLNEIEKLKEKIKINPDDFQSYIKLGNIYFDINEKSEAIFCYNNALKIDSSNSDVRIDMAICYYESGDSKTAIKEIEKSLKFAPNHPKAHYNLGIINYSIGNIDKAVESWKKFLVIEPQGELAEKVKEYIKNSKTL